MEYLVIIAFVGLIIFKVIKKSCEVNKEETGKTILPGKQSVTSRETKEPLQPADSWEEWFADEMTKQKVPAIQKVISSDSSVEVHPPIQEKVKKEMACKQPVCCEPRIKLNSSEELRRAIIYSEILNRKY